MIKNISTETIHSIVNMRQDGLKLIDPTDGSENTFNFYTLGEIVKGCLVHFCHLSIEAANKCIESYVPFNSTIDSVNSMYLFSHEHPYHWAMMAFYGHMYWLKYPGLEIIPKDYDIWVELFIKEHNLQEDILVTKKSSADDGVKK